MTSKRTMTPDGRPAFRLTGPQSENRPAASVTAAYRGLTEDRLDHTSTGSKALASRAATTEGGLRRRKPLVASSMPAAVQRTAICASHQRFTFRQTCRITAFIDSMMFVDANDRRSSSGMPRRVTVRISSSPSRMLFDMPTATRPSGSTRPRAPCPCRCRRRPGMTANPSIRSPSSADATRCKR